MIKGVRRECHWPSFKSLPGRKKGTEIIGDEKGDGKRGRKGDGDNWPFRPIYASAASLLDFRVDRLQFHSGVADFHLPVDPSLGCVDVG